MPQSDASKGNSDPTLQYPGATSAPAEPELNEAALTAESGAMSKTEVSGLVRTDQRKRWKQGERVSAEKYIANFPSLQGNDAALLDLICNEVLLREENGERPAVEEYVRRFPNLEAPLRRQFALHAMLESKRSAGITAHEGEKAPAIGAAPRISGYEVLDELGRGGMGVVYKARHTKLNRVVALKMVLSGEHAGKDDRLRFRTEAEAVASLQHSNIVQIYEVGEQDGRPFFSLEYVSGGNLDAKLEREAPLAPTIAAQLIETLARAMDAAHQRGIIHRDLKPGNVLLTSDGVPKITDFGLAKRLDAPGQTTTGSVMGTPSYMSPEQADGRTHEVGTPTDVWALGAMLYETLTGRPPFLADSPLDTLLLVVKEDPVPPARLNRKVPRDLETICLKCLAKDQRRRYPSALALADDLHHFLHNEPIQARPVAGWERAYKWAKRRPAAAGMVLVGALALVALIGVGVWYNGHLKEALEKSDIEKDKAKKARDLADEQMLRLRIVTGTQLVDSGDLLGSLPWFAEVLEKDPQRAHMHRIRLGAVLRKSPKFSQLWFHNGRVLWAAFSPDGSRAVTCSADNTARLWNVESGKPIGDPLQHDEDVLFASFDAEGKRVVTASDDHSARVWDAFTSKPLTPFLKHGGTVWRARFSPDGARVVTASRDGTAGVWDAATGTEVVKLKHDEPVRDASWNAAGSWILTASDDHTARVWDAATGTPVGKPLRHEKAVLSAAFNQNGDKVATASADYTARVWHAATGEPLSGLLHHRGAVVFTAFSPDPEGRLLVTAGQDNRARLWDGNHGYSHKATLRHGSEVMDASFSRDGQLLVTAGDDNDARVWDTATGEARGSPLKHVATVYRATFSPGGNRVLTACADGSARVWGINGKGSRATTLEHAEPVTSGVFHPSGDEVLTADTGGTAAVWDARTGKRSDPVMKHKAAIHRASYNGAGSLIVTASADHTARVWYAVSHLPVGPPLQHDGDVCQAAFSPDGRRVVTASADKTARVWDAQTSALICEFSGHTAPVYWAVFSPDGRYVASASGDKTAQVWNAANAKLLFRIAEHTETVDQVAFSPDGRYLVTASDDRTARVWYAQTGQPVCQPLLHASKVTKAQFSPNSERIVTGSSDDTARIWEAAAGQALTPPLRHEGTINSVCFSRDGQCIATCSDDNTARMWDADTGEPLTPPLQHNRGVVDVAFDIGGAHLITASTDRTAQTWYFPPDPRPVADLMLIAKLLAGGSIDKTGGFVPLQPAELSQTWDAARRLFHGSY